MRAAATTRFVPACLLLACLVAAGCAPRQEYRSAAEASCAAEAERLVLDRNRARSVRLDTPGTGAQTIMEETNFSARLARDSEFSERRRLTRECLERLGAAESQRNAATPAPAPASSSPAGQPAPASRAAPGGFERGTALPPPAATPASAPASAPGAAPQPAVRGW
jgi:hypothetical protein